VSKWQKYAVTSKNRFKLVRLWSEKDEITQMTPLHVAAKAGNADFIKSTLVYCPDIRHDVLDGKRNSLYHYAAQKNAKTVEASRGRILSQVLHIR